MSDAVMSTWTIYQSPLDEPGKVVVRRFDVFRGQREPVPAQEAEVFDTVEAARLWVQVWHPGLYCMSRLPADHVSVVETWL